MSDGFQIGGEALRAVVNEVDGEVEREMNVFDFRMSSIHSLRPSYHSWSLSRTRGLTYKPPKGVTIRSTRSGWVSKRNVSARRNSKWVLFQLTIYFLRYHWKIILSSGVKVSHSGWPSTLVKDKNLPHNFFVVNEINVLHSG